MAWKKTDDLLRIRLNQHGLGELVQAGLICREAENLSANIFEAVSVSNGILHVNITKQNQLKLLMVQGKLLKDLKTFCTAKNLQEIKRIRLTITPA